MTYHVARFVAPTPRAGVTIDIEPDLNVYVRLQQYLSERKYNDNFSININIMMLITFSNKLEKIKGANGTRTRTKATCHMAQRWWYQSTHTGATHSPFPWVERLTFRQESRAWVELISSYLRPCVYCCEGGWVLSYVAKLFFQQQPKNVYEYSFGSL